MSINNILEKVKQFYPLLLILAIGSIFFGLGRLSKLESEQTPIKVEYYNASSTASVITASVSSKSDISNSKRSTTLPVPEGSGEVIGSKTGKKYYYPWCGTVKRIKPENQVHFNSIEEARAAGFLPGGNCKGLK